MDQAVREAVREAGSEDDTFPRAAAKQAARRNEW
jgi:hypothetical protein